MLNTFNETKKPRVLLRSYTLTRSPPGLLGDRTRTPDLAMTHPDPTITNQPVIVV